MSMIINDTEFELSKDIFDEVLSRVYDRWLEIKDDVYFIEGMHDFINDYTEENTLISNSDGICVHFKEKRYPYCNENGLNETNILFKIDYVFYSDKELAELKQKQLDKIEQDKIDKREKEKRKETEDAKEVERHEKEQYEKLKKKYG